MFNTLDGPFLNRIQELGNVVYKNLDELQLLCNVYEFESVQFKWTWM